MSHSYITAVDDKLTWPVAHIDAVQIELSAWYTDHEEDGLIAAARENNVAIVAYSPLGKGVLTGAITDKSQMTSAVMKDAPRFNEHWEHNKKLVDKFSSLAEKKGCSPGQLAIAWVSAQGAIPIPGTKSIGRLEENFGAGKVDLTQEELDSIRALIKDAGTTGDRYAPVHMAMIGK